jgi:hypothetical protein
MRLVRDVSAASAANSLPTPLRDREIPLTAGSTKHAQDIDLDWILDVERAHFGAETRFFPALREM